MTYFRRVLCYVKPQYRTVLVSVFCAMVVSVLFSLSIVAMLPLIKVMIGEEDLHGWVHRTVISDQYGMTLQPLAVQPVMGKLSAGDISADPSTDPSTDHLTGPSTGPSTDASTDPSTDPLTEPADTTAAIPVEAPSPSSAAASVVATAHRTASPAPRIIKLKDRSVAANAGLQIGDQLLSVNRIDDRDCVPPITDHYEILDTLAGTTPDTSFTLTVLRETATNSYTHNVTLTPRTTWKSGMIRSFADSLLRYVPRRRDDDFRRNSIIAVIIVILIATLLRCVLRFIQEYLVLKVAFRSIMQLRDDAFDKALRMPLTFFSREGYTSTMSRFVQDSAQIQAGITTLLGKTVREPFKIIVLLLAAVMINPKMTLLVMTVAPVAGVVLNKLGKKMKRATRRTLESWSRVLLILQETLLGIRIVKGYHKEGYEHARFKAINSKLFEQQCRMGRIDAAGSPMIEALGITGACVGLIVAAHWLFVPGHSSGMNTSDFITLVAILGTLGESGRKLGDVYTKFQTANASAERVYHLIDAEIETDPPNAVQLSPLHDSLAFEAVTFKYPGSSETNLAEVNLAVKAGETVAIVGPNGSGKTTLLSLIPRFFVPQQGRVLIDGVDINQATLESLRGQIGIVTQQSIVFYDTIASNIAYGAPQATREQVIEAARQAYAHDFIQATADGYDTIIGEQGTTLSGGQLQRLAIARAILRDPAILIFDEATSQIDSESEARIQEVMTDFTRGRTSFIIAHRLSTIVHADRIVVLDSGRVVAQGSHQSLLASCALYKQLYSMQFVSEDNGAADPGRSQDNPD